MNDKENYDIHLPDFRIEELICFYADAGRQYSWGLDFLKIRDVHNLTKGGGVIIGIVDTEDTPDTRHLVYDQHYSERFTNEGPDVESNSGHGVHVGDTAQQVAPESVIGLVKVLRNEGSGYQTWIANGIRWFVDRVPRPEHAGFSKIINLSLGSPFPSPIIEDAIKYGVSKNVTFVVAAGNSGGKVGFPGGYDPIVITSSAIDKNGNIASFSDRGPAIDLGAPGVGIVAEFRGGLAALSGTSMAAPHVTGILALILSYHRSLEDPEAYLKDNAKDVGKEGEDDLFGAGIPIATNYFGDIPDPPDPPDIGNGTPAWLIVVVVVAALIIIGIIIFKP